MTTIFDIFHNSHLFFFFKQSSKNWANLPVGVMIGKDPTHLGLLEAVSYDQSTEKSSNHTLYTCVYRVSHDFRA